jgi:hypothetical protein
MDYLGLALEDPSLPESSQQGKQINIEADPNLDSENSKDGETENKKGEKELKSEVEEHVAMEVPRPTLSQP